MLEFLSLFVLHIHNRYQGLNAGLYDVGGIGISHVSSRGKKIRNRFDFYIGFYLNNFIDLDPSWCGFK